MTNQRTSVSGLEGDQSVAATDGHPTSCKDLRLLGHVVNGLFSVTGNYLGWKLFSVILLMKSSMIQIQVLHNVPKSNNKIFKKIS